MVAATDTHSLIRAATGKWKRLGRRARRLFEAADRRQAVIYVPVFVLAEVSELTQAGAVTLPLPFPRWLQHLRQSGSHIILDLTSDVVLRAHDLFDIPEQSDRLIAATAAVHQLPLITRDPAIAACAQVQLLWD